jgi:TatD DNase family protein
MKAIDIHAHLSLMKDPESALQKARDNEIGVVNCVIDSKLSYNTLLTIGAVPSNLNKDYLQAQITLICKNIDKIIGIGEIGLDYYWSKETKSQKQNFIKLLKLAKEFNKPVVVHSRNAEQDSLAILQKEKIESALFHCFSGTIKTAKDCIDAGYLISVPTTALNSKAKQRTALAVGLDNIVLESDAPYLSIVKGKENEPLNILQTAAKLAKLYDCSVDEVCRITTKNAMHFFKLSF